MKQGIFKKISTFLLGSILALGVGVAVSAPHKDAMRVDADSTGEMTSFTAISGIVNNDANISYEASKGNAGTAPAVNNSEIRIYQNGGLLNITPNNSAVINAVTIGSSMATKVQVSVDSGTFSSDNNITANGTFTIDSLTASNSVLFKCTGTDKYSRLYLNYLSVTYTIPSGIDALPAPSKLSVSNGVISWEQVSGNNGYSYVINTNPATTGDIEKDAKSFDTKTLANLDEGTTYEFKIKAKGDGVNYLDSDYSSSLEFSLPINTEWVLTNLDDLTTNDTFVIVGDNGDTYALGNNNGTSSAPDAVDVTISKGKISSSVTSSIKWNLSKETNGYIFYPNGSTTSWLYSTSSNNGIRVGDGAAKLFNRQQSSGYLTVVVNETTRYLGIYDSSDWRSYDSINSNITGQTFSFYKAVAITDDTTTVLSVSSEIDKYSSTTNTWTGITTDTLNVSDFTVTCTTTDAPGYVFQGIGTGAGDDFVARDASFTSGNPSSEDTRLQWKATHPTTPRGETYLYAYVNLSVSLPPEVHSITLTPSTVTVATESSGKVTSLFASIVIDQDEGCGKTVSDITWTSDDENVIAISDDDYLAGDVHKSSTTIYASIGGTVYGSATVKLVDPDAPYISYETPEYLQRITSTNSLEAGVYAIVNEEASKGLSTTQAENNRSAVDVTISEGVINDIPDGLQLLTLSQATIGDKTGWQLYTGEGYLYAASSSSNYLRTQATNNTNGLFTITFSGNNAVLTAQGGNTRNIIKYNTSSPIFSCYSSGQKAVQLYKLMGESGTIDIDSDIMSVLNTVMGNYEDEHGDTQYGIKICDYFRKNVLDKSTWLSMGESFTSALQSKYKLNYAIANRYGNDLEKFLSAYDYVVENYGAEYDFLGRIEGGQIVVNERTHAFDLITSLSSGNNASVILIISVISLATLGGTVLIRKRKEQE